MEAELNYQIIAENASDAIIRIDENSTILFVNYAAEKIFGYKKEEMLGQNLTFLMSEHLREVHTNAITRYLQTGKKTLDWNRVEVPGSHKDGSIISLEISFGEYQKGDKKYFVGVIRDVTERNRIEQSVRESEKVLQGTLDALTAHIAVLDNKGFIKTVNKAWRTFAETNNFSSNTFGVGYNYIEACRVESDAPTVCRMQGEKACEGIKDVIAGRLPLFELEYPCHSPTENRWFIMRVTPYSDEKNSGVVVAHENITNRKIAEQNTRISEEKYRVLSEAIPAFMFVTNNKGETTFANRQWYEYTGYTEAQTLATGWIDAIHPEDMSGVFEEWMKSVNEKKVFEAEYRLQKHNGEYRWFLVRVIPQIDSEENVIDWYGTATDIEERKIIEEELSSSEIFNRVVLESSPDCITLLDDKGYLLFINGNGLCQMEIDDFEPIKGTPWWEFWLEESHDVVKDSVKKALAGETARFEAFCPTPKGTPKWWDVIVLPIEETKTNNNYSARLLSVSRDITETKRISEALLKAEVEQRNQAEAANLAKDEFLSVLSHELRTPLNAMLGWVRMLKSGNLDKNRTEQAVEVIERNIVLQNELIEDLLDVSRIISGKMLIEKELVVFSDVILNALDIARPLSEKKNIKLSFNNSVGFQKILGDETRLHQIIINLLNNAVKFTPENGSINLNLSTDENDLILEIQDTGVGIDSEFLPYVFERFRQADSTTKRTYSGLGLGLTIVNHLTALHDGTIEVFSKGDGKGTTFTLYFPIHREKVSKTVLNSDNTENISSTEKDFPLSDVRILIVDDDLDGMIPLQILLEQQKAKVETATSANEALEVLADIKFDILISDIGMPETDGYELIRNLRGSDKNKQIPAIALTAYASLSDREKALKLGFQKHIAKPLDFDLLIEMLIEIHENNSKS